MSCEKSLTECLTINYSDEPVIETSRSIFLAGPTPRKKEVPSWRPDAIKILQALNFRGVVYVPERKDWEEGYDYDTQVHWEWKALAAAGIIAFWVPRKLPDMPAFTTNVEFGMTVGNGRVVYGRPDWAEKKGYLDKVYKHYTGREPQSSLHNLLTEAFWRVVVKEGP